MSPLTARRLFRSLLLGQWVLALVVTIAELWLPLGASIAVDEGSGGIGAVSAGVDAVSIVALVLGIVTTVGLFRFAAWAPRLLVLTVLVSLIAMAVLPPAAETSLASLFDWVDGIITGIILAWVFVARETLPFRT